MLNYQVYRNNSNSPWVIFLHGIGGSIATWKRQIDAFQNYNILLIDLPGHGKSECKCDVTVKSVNDSIKEVMDHLHISKADFVSLSLGTLVALHFAIKYPKRVKTIVLGGSILNIEGFYKFLMKITCAIKRIVPYRLLFNILAKIMLPKKNHKVSRKIFIRESLKLNRKTFLQWLNYITEIMHPDNIMKKIKALKIKMFFISGDEDVCFLSGTKKISDVLTQSEMHIIEKCGHVCSIEKASEFNTECLRFLNTKPALA